MAGLRIFISAGTRLPAPSVWHISGASVGLLWCLMLFAGRAPLTGPTLRGARISHVSGKRCKGRTPTMQRSRGSLHCTSDGEAAHHNSAGTHALPDASGPRLLRRRLVMGMSCRDYGHGQGGAQDHIRCRSKTRATPRANGWRCMRHAHAGTAPDSTFLGSIYDRAASVTKPI